MPRSDDGALPRREPATEPDARTDPLGMTGDEMRALGYRLVDRVVRHVLDGRDGPAQVTGSASALAAVLGGPVPEGRGDPAAGLDRLEHVALAAMQHNDHPRYFARVPGPASFTGILGSWLATGFNANVASWAGGSGPATVELTVCRWIGDALGLAGAEGILTSGGSAANLTALAAVRAVRGPGVAYLGDQAHASVRKALRALGWPADHVRVLPSGRDLRLHPEAVAHAVAVDRAAGRLPLLLVATAGTTNTGAVDPLDALADLAGSEGLWLHVDGAYGAPAALTERGRRLLAGLPRVDSLALDPHKWLFQPYDTGMLLVRHAGLLERAFTDNPEYLAHTTSTTPGEVDLRNRGLELSRRSRALGLWLTLQTHGLPAVRSAVDAGLDRAESAAALVAADDRWEVVTPATLGVVTFARRDAGAAEHEAAARAVTRGGFASVATTVLHGRTVLRLCTLDPRTTEADVAATLRLLAAAFPS
jgi:glutamate/tyrosine decarboxylase-like PLP-dependent enzyme